MGNFVDSEPVNEPIVDCTGPFQVGVHSDADSATDGAGFCLHYRQLPC